MKNSDKVTLTVGQLKKLLKEDINNPKNFDEKTKEKLYKQAKLELKQIRTLLNKMVSEYGMNSDFNKYIEAANVQLSYAEDNLGFGEMY